MFSSIARSNSSMNDQGSGRDPDQGSGSNSLASGSSLQSGTVTEMVASILREVKDQNQLLKKQSRELQKQSRELQEQSRELALIK